MPTVDELAKDLSDLKAKTDASIADIKKNLALLAARVEVILEAPANVSALFGVADVHDLGLLRVRDDVDDANAVVLIVSDHVAEGARGLEVMLAQ